MDQLYMVPDHVYCRTTVQNDITHSGGSIQINVDQVKDQVNSRPTELGPVINIVIFKVKPDNPNNSGSKKDGLDKRMSLLNTNNTILKDLLQNKFKKAYRNKTVEVPAVENKKETELGTSFRSECSAKSTAPDINDDMFRVSDITDTVKKFSKVKPSGDFSKINTSPIKDSAKLKQEDIKVKKEFSTSGKNNILYKKCNRQEFLLHLEMYRKPFECGWKRELVIRSTFDTNNKRAADVYYYTPVGKKVRSRRELVHFIDGVTLDQSNFTFYKELIGIGPPKEIIRNAGDKTCLGISGNRIPRCKSSSPNKSSTSLPKKNLNASSSLKASKKGLVVPRGSWSQRCSEMEITECESNKIVERSTSSDLSLRTCSGTTGLERNTSSDLSLRTCSGTTEQGSLQKNVFTPSANILQSMLLSDTTVKSCTSSTRTGTSSQHHLTADIQIKQEILVEEFIEITEPLTEIIPFVKTEMGGAGEEKDKAKVSSMDVDYSFGGSMSLYNKDFGLDHWNSFSHLENSDFHSELFRNMSDDSMWITNVKEEIDIEELPSRYLTMGSDSYSK